MQVLPLAGVRARLSAVVDEVEQAGERVTITRDGIPVAVVLSVDDLTSLEETLAYRVSEPLAGQYSARRGAYRVRYRIDDDQRLVTVVDIAYRADAYYPGRS